MHACPRPETTRLAAALAALGLCLVGGCATLPPSDGPAAWNLSQDDQQVRLAWGRPDSDEVGLMLSCAPHAGALAVSAPVAVGARRLLLSSEGRAGVFTGPVETDPETGEPLLTAQARVGDPTLASFARTGHLSALGPDGALAMTASGADRERVRAFFARCAA